jgi:hypothetical protein
MSTCPTANRINAALDRAAKTARDHTKHSSRLLKSPLPKYGSEPRGERWWLIGHIRVLGEQERWEVLFDPVTDEGRLRQAPWRWR